MAQGRDIRRAHHVFWLLAVYAGKHGDLNPPCHVDQARMLRLRDVVVDWRMRHGHSSYAWKHKDRSMSCRVGCRLVCFVTNRGRSVRLVVRGAEHFRDVFTARGGVVFLVVGSAPGGEGGWVDLAFQGHHAGALEIAPGRYGHGFPFVEGVFEAFRVGGRRLDFGPGFRGVPGHADDQLLAASFGFQALVEGGFSHRGCRFGRENGLRSNKQTRKAAIARRPDGKTPDG